MTFDFFAAIGIFLSGLVVGIVITWGVITHPVQVNRWTYYHAPWAYSLVNNFDPIKPPLPAN